MLLTKQLLGLDLGSHSIKVARLQKKKDKYVLSKFGQVRVPVNTVVDGSIMNTYEMNDAIKTLVAREKISDKYCAISIAGHGVINRMVNIPEVKPEAFEEALKLEAEAHMPHDISEIYFSGIRTGSMEQGKEKVVLVAARQELIEDFLQVVHGSGVRSMCVEIDATALANVFEVNYKEELDKTVAILNVGASKINVVILSNGVFSYYRDVNTGGNYISEEISKRLKIGFQQAESLKSGDESTEDSILPREVENVVANVAATMATDVSRVFDYYSNINPDDAISKVFITGGTTRSQTFVSAFKSALSVPVEKLNPFKDIVVAPGMFSADELEDYAHIAAVSLGLALRRLDD